MTQDLSQLTKFIANLPDIPPDLEDRLARTIDEYQSDPDLIRIRDELKAEAEGIEGETNGGPPAKMLWEKASRAGFADIVADLSLADDAKGNGHKITLLQAFFCGWYSIFTRKGGTELLKMVDLPTTKTDIAIWLGKSRPTLYKWMAADWFTSLGVDSWVNQGLMEIIPDAINRLHYNVVNGNGPTSNAAIKITLDARNGPPGTQINVLQQQAITNKLVILPAQDE